jgi:predicted transcriptional regulator
MGSNTEDTLLETKDRPVDARNRALMLPMDADHREQSINVAKALGSAQRLRILDYLQTRVANVSEIAEALEMPLSTANLHIGVLEESGLIRSDLISASRGVQKVCARIYDMVVLQLPRSTVQFDRHENIHMPIGAYTECHVIPTCGLTSETAVIGYLDDPVSFYEPNRFAAQLIWFRQGYLEYRFPYRAYPERQPKNLMEINGQPIGTWTSPGDFGGERGNLTPDWWEEWNSQYGLLKSWRVDQSGSWIDGVHLSGITIDDLHLDDQPFIRVRFGIHKDAHNVGGLNLFGRKFGNYPQDIMMQVHYG